MGNNNSKEGGEGGAGHSLPSSPVTPRKTSRRNDSMPGGVIPRATAAAPATSLESAVGQSASSGRSSVSQPRGRSSTQSSATQAIPVPSRDSKGRTTSTSERPDREKPERPRVSTSATTPNRSVSPGHRTAPRSTPIAIDPSADKLPPSATPEGIASPDQYYLPQAQFLRPPRLPIPIEEETHDPGSPIPLPADASVPEVPLDTDDTKSLSHISYGEPEGSEAGGDENIFGPLVPGMESLPKVPFLFEWKEGGDSKVYVTGSFCLWEKKYKLVRDGPSPDPHAKSVIIRVPPGTHYVMFLIDGDQRFSNFLPATVEWGNKYVNFIEIPVMTRAAAEAENDRLLALKPPHHARQQAIPPTPELRPTGLATSGVNRSGSQKHRPSSQHHNVTSPHASTPTIKMAPHNAKYTNDIPQYLLNLDAPEGTSRYARANAIMETQPTPPSLPMFLSKSILNGATPIKDDASVLVMPNHTVLNHLATSSIKSGVLAVSATTRYKKKYVTTILYKPTSIDD